MATYGKFKYGTTTYGVAPTPTPAPPPTPTPTPTPPPTPIPNPGTGASGSDAALVGIPSIAYEPGVDVQPLLVDALDYGYVRVTWTSPGPRVVSLRLVRNSTGYATDENDGVVLYSGVPGTNRFEDRTVLRGHEYFYTVFLQLSNQSALATSTSLATDPGLTTGSGVTPYFPAAIARCAAVQDYGSSEFLVDGLPRMYTSPAQNAVDEPDYNGQLARFLKIFGFQFDKLRTDLANMWPFHDAKRIPGTQLPELLNEMGQALEFGLGYRQSRILARDIMYHYSRKGTTAGTSALGKALTGLGVVTQVGPNLMFDTDDSSFETGVGRWAAVTNCAIQRDVTATNINTPPVPGSPAPVLYFKGLAGGALAVKATANGSMLIRLGGVRGDTAGPPLWGVPVTPRDVYAFSAYLKAGSTSSSVTLAIEWRDLVGGLLATSTQASPATDTTTYSRTSFTATAPDYAAYASLTMSWSTPANAEVHYVDDVQFERLSITVPDGDMEQDISSLPWSMVAQPSSQVNLVSNPEFSTDTSGWASATGLTAATLARSTSQYNVTPASLLVTWPTTVAGNSGVQYTASNLNIGQRYRFSLYVYVPAGSPAVRIGETQGHGYSPAYETQTTGTTKNAWVSLAFSVIADRTTMTFGVLLDASATSGNTCYLDSATLTNLAYPFAQQIAVDGSTYNSGSQSLKVQGFASGADTYLSQSLKVIPGQTYLASAYVNVGAFTAGALGNRGLYVTDGVTTATATSGGTQVTSYKLQAPPAGTGAYLGFASGNNDAVQTYDFEVVVGNKFAIAPFYVDSSNTGDSAAWPTANMKAMYDGGTITTSSGTRTIPGGRIPHVRWESALYGGAGSQAAGMPAPAGSATVTGGGSVSAYTYAQILAGALDTYINARAAAVKAWGKPILITFDHECDSFNSLATTTSARRQAATAGSPTTTQFAAAWQYIKAKFDAAGCANVTWVFTLSGAGGTNISACQLGVNDYDWIGLDSYILQAAVNVHDRWQAFISRLDNGEAGTSGRVKPIMIAEWGVDAAYGARTTAFNQVVTALQTATLPRVGAICYNNVGSNLFTSTTADVTGFKTMALNGYLNPTLTVKTTVTTTSPTLGTYSTITGTTSGYVQHQASIVPTTSNVQLRLYVPQGVVNYDDVRFSLANAQPYEDARRVNLYVFPDRENFCTNPGFEVSAANWAATNASLTGFTSSTTLARSTAQSKSGSASLLVTHPTAAKSGVSTVVSDLTVGQAYTVSAQVYLPTGSPSVVIQHDALPFTVGPFVPTVTAGVVVNGSAKNYGLTVSASVNLTEVAYPEQANAWCRIDTTFVATAQIHNVAFYSLNTTAGQTFYLDEVLIEPGTGLGDYFDGGPNTDPTQNTWEATFGLSRSRYIRNVAVKAARLARRVEDDALPVGSPYAIRAAWPGLATLRATSLNS